MDFRQKIFLAPMAGITETVFRSLCRENGADVVMSEMVSAEGIFRRSKKTRDLLKLKEFERPIGIQIFGSHPGHIAYCAAFIEEHYRPDFIDFNCGCPVPKVVNKNGGAALLRDEPLFQKIVSSMVKAVSTPVTVKLRSGWAQNEWVDAQFAKIAQDSGAAAVILHPRSRTMVFSGHSYWERIAVVKSAVSIPVIGNGDITSARDAKSMYEQTGCDSIMIGRAALGNPWIFNQIKGILLGKAPDLPTPEMRLSVVVRHVESYCLEYGEEKAADELKKHLAWYCKGLPCAAAMRNDIFRASTMVNLKKIILTAFQASQSSKGDRHGTQCHSEHSAIAL
jgi:tRNA-dihydrouridine synthase B